MSASPFWSDPLEKAWAQHWTERRRKEAISRSLRERGVIFSGGRMFTTTEAAERAARGEL